MADLRIVDAPEIPTENITGEEKLPTGGSGNYSISLDSLADYTKTKKDLADNTSVDGKVGGVRQELDTHIEDLLNPHQVTKGQIGLGNVDNTADADKPVSTSTQAAIISAVAPKSDKSYVDNALSSKSDKTYVDNQLTLKANKADVYTKSETYTKQESSALVNSSISTALTPVNTSLDLAKRGVINRYDSSLTYNSGERVVLTNGDIVKSTVDGNTNNPNVDMTGWDFVNTRPVKTVRDLLTVKHPTDGKSVNVFGYHSATTFALASPYQGGGQFIFNANLEKSKHNGGTIIDPDRPFPTDWSNQDQVQTWFTPVSTSSGVWIRVSTDEHTIKIDDFGARGDGIHDDRIPLQASYDFLNSVGGGTVYYSSNNTYLINSYLYKYFHGELLQLYSNITHVSYGATIKVGAFLDDKIFVLFNGFDNATPELSSLIYNVKFDGLTFDFSGDVSRMRTSYKRRVGIQVGRVIGGYVRNCKFKNGDLQNAIIAGWGNTGDSFYVHDNAYVDLVQESPENVDFTAVYLCAKNSYVTDCIFLESSVRAYEIGCAVELHASNSRFTNSFVAGLTKACFLVSTPTENTIVTDLKVSGIVGFVANSLTSPWSGDGCTLARLDISNNYMRSYQLAGTSIDVHGYRGLVTTYSSFGSGLYADIWVKGNVCLIENSANPNTATAVYSNAKMDRLVVDGNELVNCHDGVVLLAADQDWSGLKITRNNFSGINPSALLRLTGNNLDNIVVHGNIANYFGIFDAPINIASNTITNSSIQETTFTKAVPQTREFTYPIDFINAVSNKATFKLYARQLNTPGLAAGGVGAATVNVPTDCIKAGCSYEFIGAIPSQIALSSKTVASANPVAFIALNKEAYVIGEDTRTGAIRVSINN